MRTVEASLIRLRGALVAALFALAASNLFAVGTAQAQSTYQWVPDANHSQVGFSVRHFFTPIRGTFADYEIELDFDPDQPNNSSVRVVIEVASVDTGIDRRDNHLRSADFFDVESHPQITFESSSVEAVGEGELIARGALTIKGISRQIELPITLLGVSELSPALRRSFGRRVASFTAGVEIDRRDFEVGRGSFAETAVVGAEVEIAVSIEAGERPVSTEDS